MFFKWRLVLVFMKNFVSKDDIHYARDKSGKLKWTRIGLYVVIVREVGKITRDGKGK